MQQTNAIKSHEFDEYSLYTKCIEFTILWNFATTNTNNISAKKYCRSIRATAVFE